LLAEVEQSVATYKTKRVGGLKQAVPAPQTHTERKAQETREAFAVMEKLGIC
jgi:hypothetical protein